MDAVRLLTQRWDDGSPTQCRFPFDPTVDVVAGDSDFPGGPAELESCFCLDL